MVEVTVEVVDVTVGWLITVVFVIDIEDALARLEGSTLGGGEGRETLLLFTVNVLVVVLEFTRVIFVGWGLVLFAVEASVLLVITPFPRSTHMGAVGAVAAPAWPEELDVVVVVLTMVVLVPFAVVLVELELEVLVASGLIEIGRMGWIIEDPFIGCVTVVVVTVLLTIVDEPGVPIIWVVVDVVFCALLLGESKPPSN